MYVEYSRTLIMIFRGPLNFSQNDLLATSDKKNELQYLEKYATSNS